MAVVDECPHGASIQPCAPIPSHLHSVHKTDGTQLCTGARGRQDNGWWRTSGRNWIALVTDLASYLLRGQR